MCALPGLFFGWPALLRYDEQASLQQFLRQPIESQREFVRNGAHAYAEHDRGFDLRIFLKYDPAQQLTIKRAKLLETVFDVKNEDHGVFKSADRAT